MKITIEDQHTKIIVEDLGADDAHVSAWIDMMRRALIGMGFVPEAIDEYLNMN